MRKSHLVYLFLLAFAFRAVIISLFGQEPGADHIWNDAVAWNLAQGNGFTASQHGFVPAIFRSPGYPTFLDLIYSLFGHSFKAGFLANAVLDSFSTVFLALIVAKLSSVRHALLSGALYALYPYPAMFCGMLIQDTLVTFLVMSVLLVLVSEPKWKWVSLGLLLGCLALTKPFLVLFAVVPVFYVRKLRHVLIMGLVGALTITPWVIRNYVYFHSFPPLSVGGTGENLGILVAELDGGERLLVKKYGSQTILNPTYRYDPSHASEYLDNFVDGKSLIELEKQRSAEYAPILEARWREYLPNVFRHLWRNWITKNAGRFGLIAFLISGSVLAFGLIGMWVERKNQLLPLYLTVLWITLIYAPYSQESRYMLPARPAMIAFCASALLVAYALVGDYIRARSGDRDARSRSVGDFESRRRGLV